MSNGSWGEPLENGSRNPAEPWRNERIEAILHEAGIVYDGTYSFNQSTGELALATTKHTRDDLLARIKSLESKYKLTQIDADNKEWLKDSKYQFGHFRISFEDAE